MTCLCNATTLFFKEPASGSISLITDFTFGFTSFAEDSANKRPVVSWIMAPATAAVKEPLVPDVDTPQGLADDHGNVADGDLVT